MNKLYYFIDLLVKHWPNMNEGQRNEFCNALSTGNPIIMMKILKEVENENKIN